MTLQLMFIKFNMLIVVIIEFEQIFDSLVTAMLKWFPLHFENSSTFF